MIGRQSVQIISNRSGNALSCPPINVVLGNLKTRSISFSSAFVGLADEWKNKQIKHYIDVSNWSQFFLTYLKCSWIKKSISNLWHFWVKEKKSSGFFCLVNKNLKLIFFFKSMWMETNNWMYYTAYTKITLKKTTKFWNSELLFGGY